MSSSKSRGQIWITMSICVLAGLVALSMLIAEMADELDPVGEFARTASKFGLVVIAVVLLAAYYFRRRQAKATRAKSRRRRHRRRFHQDGTLSAEQLRASEKPAPRSGADVLK